MKKRDKFDRVCQSSPKGESELMGENVIHAYINMWKEGATQWVAASTLGKLLPYKEGGKNCNIMGRKENVIAALCVS